MPDEVNCGICQHRYIPPVPLLELFKYTVQPKLLLKLKVKWLYVHSFIELVKRGVFFLVGEIRRYRNDRCYYYYYYAQVWHHDDISQFSIGEYVFNLHRRIYKQMIK